MPKNIIIFSTKGGVGKTLLAVNLAVSLANIQAEKVCLLDLDLHVVGDMARMLDLKPQKAMVDLISQLKKAPQDFKKENFLMHASSGVDFLPGILRSQQSPHLDPEKIKDVFDLLDKDYDYIIVDAGRSFSDVFVYIL